MTDSETVHNVLCGHAALRDNLVFPVMSRITNRFISIRQQNREARGLGGYGLPPLPPASSMHHLSLVARRFGHLRLAVAAWAVPDHGHAYTP